MINGCGDLGNARKKNYSINCWQHIRVLPPAECWLLLEERCPQATFIPGVFMLVLIFLYALPQPSSFFKVGDGGKVQLCESDRLTYLHHHFFISKSSILVDEVFSSSTFFSKWHLILLLCLIYKGWWQRMWMDLHIRKDAILLSPLQFY